MSKQLNRKRIISVGILLVLIAVFALIYFFHGPKAGSGEKSVTLTVIDKEQEKQVYKLNTDATVLREVMDEAEGLSFSGKEGQYGLMVESVNGVRAVYELDDAYWNFFVNDAYCKYGIDTQPVNDGDEFTIQYTPASE